MCAVSPNTNWIIMPSIVLYDMDCVSQSSAVVGCVLESQQIDTLMIFCKTLT